MNPKKSVFTFLIMTIGLISTFIITLYMYDPMQIFHKPWGREVSFHQNMRQQAAGIIKNYEFDSIILGKVC